MCVIEKSATKKNRCALIIFHVFQIRLGDIFPSCASDLSNHTEVSLCPRPERPGLDTSVQSAWVSLKSAYPCSLSFCHMFHMLMRVYKFNILTVLALLCPCLQSYVCVGHLSTDYGGLHSGRSLGGSLPYTSGLGQALAGQQNFDPLPTPFLLTHCNSLCIEPSDTTCLKCKCNFLGSNNVIHY